MYIYKHLYIQIFNYIFKQSLVLVQPLSHVGLFVTSWTVVCQDPLSIGFPGKSAGVGCQFLLQRIFLTQGQNPYLLHWQAESLPLSHQGGPSYICQYVCNKYIHNRSYIYIHTYSTTDACRNNSFQKTKICQKNEENMSKIHGN